MSVHFLSDQGWHSLGQTTGFIFKQRLPPFLSSAEIRYGIQNMSLSLTPTPSHITRQGRQLSCCIVRMIYAQTSRHTLSLSLSLCLCFSRDRSPHGNKHVDSWVKTEGISMQNQLTKYSQNFLQTV